MMKKISIITLVTLLILTVSCAETQQVLETAGRVQLDGTYNITALEGETVNGQTIVFSGLTKRVSGDAGCNTYFADYTLNNLSLNIGEIGSTRKSCPDMNDEDKLFDVLRRVASYNKNDGVLTLYGQNSSEVILQASQQ